MMSDPRFNVSALVFGEQMIGEIVQRLVFPAGRDKRKDHPCARGARGTGAARRQTEKTRVYLQVPLSQVAPIGFVEPSEKARP